MESGAVDTVAGATVLQNASTPAPPAPPRRRGLGRDLTVLALVGVLLVAAVGVSVVTLYQQFYGPTAFVERYLGLLADGRASDALAVPGVGVDSTALKSAGLPEDASDALLRSAALTTITDIVAVGESELQTDEGPVTEVTISYRAGEYPGTTTFAVARDGWVGVVPAWRFATSPLTVLELVVRGSMTFDVNGFTVDKRQVSPLGVDAPPLDPVALLVFSPGAYRVSVESALAATPGVDVLADAPLTEVPIELQAEATPAFTTAVQTEVDSFLDACAAQQVLQPTGCPFGFAVQNRIASLPEWSIAAYPVVALLPAGAGWAVTPTDATAHIEVDIRSLFDGSIREVSEDVPFTMDAAITVLPDGSVSIRVGTPSAG